jgi:lipopolysaccharide export LptBFGC system permease protein LptF
MARNRSRRRAEDEDEYEDDYEDDREDEEEDEAPRQTKKRSIRRDDGAKDRIKRKTKSIRKYRDPDEERDAETTIYNLQLAGLVSLYLFVLVVSIVYTWLCWSLANTRPEFGPIGIGILVNMVGIMLALFIAWQEGHVIHIVIGLIIPPYFSIFVFAKRDTYAIPLILGVVANLIAVFGGGFAKMRSRRVELPAPAAYCQVIQDSRWPAPHRPPIINRDGT